MTDPQRLLESTDDPLIRELLGAGREEQPADDVLQRTLLVVGVGMAAGATSATAGAAVAAKVGGPAGVKAALGAAAGTAALGQGTAGLMGGAVGVKLLAAGAASGLLTWGVVTQLATPPASVVAPAAVTAPLSPSPPRRVPETSRQPLVKSEPKAAGESVETGAVRDNAPVRVVKADPARASVAAPAPDMETAPEPSELEQQVALIDEARAAVARGDAAGANRALREYAQRFPRGGLAPEAMYLRMRSKLVAGDAEGAKDSARQLLQQHPNGPHSAKARAVLEGDAP